MAQMVFDLYARQRFSAFHDDKLVDPFDPQLGSLTFKRIPSDFDRIREGAPPWDNSES
jgi:hypothetical protein